MRITESQLRKIIRESLLTEEVFGAQAFVFHGSHAKPEEFLRFMEADEFSSGGSVMGTSQGYGLYAIWDPAESDQGVFEGNYGQYVYKLKVSLWGFAIYDVEVCKKVYGRPMSIYEQLQKVGNKDAIEELKKKPTMLRRSKLEMTDPSFKKAYTPLEGYLATLVKGSLAAGQLVIYDPGVAIPVGWKDVWDENTDLGMKSGWNSFDKSSIKKSVSRSASGDYTKGKLDPLNIIRAVKSGVNKFPGDLDLQMSDSAQDYDEEVAEMYEITSLPAGLEVGGTLDLEGHFELESLPPGLKVGRNLRLINTGITTLPPGLVVGGDLYIVDTEITTLPPDIQVGGDVVMRKIPDRSNGLTVKNQVEVIPPGVKGGVRTY